MICTTYFLTFFSELIPPTGIVNKNNVCQEKEPSTPGSMQSLYPIFLTNTYQKTTVNFNLLSMLQRYMINCPAKKASRSLK